MNWGKGLALALVSFAGLMAWFIVKASQNPEPLVTERYYEQELKYQERIDASTRARGIGEVLMDATRDAVRITFPRPMDGKVVSGELLLQRPNDPTADRVVAVMGGAPFAGSVDLSPGLYNAQLTWHVDGVDYFTEQKVVVR